MEKKRVYSGAVKDRERTKQKLLNAVGEAFRSSGFNGLTVKNVIAKAGVDRKLIYDYFGGFDNLVETYLRNKDYWYGFSETLTKLLKDHQGNYGRELLQGLIEKQLDQLCHDEELQQIIRWQLTETNPLIYDLCMKRERIGNAFFELADPFFEGSGVDLHAVAALLVGGVYSLVLHAKAAGTTFCGIDLNTPEGMERIRKALKGMIERAYADGKREKEK